MLAEHLDRNGQLADLGLDRVQRRIDLCVAVPRPAGPVAPVGGRRIHPGDDPSRTERDEQGGQQPDERHDGLPREVGDVGQRCPPVRQRDGTDRIGSTVEAAES